MSQHSKLRKVIIYFKNWEIDFFIEFSENLLRKKNHTLKQGTHFKKSNNMPIDTIYLKSFLLARYQYDDHTKLIKKYSTFLNEFYSLSINQFYNFFQFLKLNNIQELDSDTIFMVLEKSNKLKNLLKEKDTINNTSDFLKIIL